MKLGNGRMSVQINCLLPTTGFTCWVEKHKLQKSSFKSTTHNHWALLGLLMTIKISTKLQRFIDNIWWILHQKKSRSLQYEHVTYLISHHSCLHSSKSYRAQLVRSKCMVFQWYIQWFIKWHCINFLTELMWIMLGFT